MGTHLNLDDVPLLAAPRGQRLPDLLAHAHVLLAQPLELPVVKLVLAAALHQPLVALPARVARLPREGFPLDLVPVLAHRAQGEQCAVVVLVPRARRGPVLWRQGPAHGSAHRLAGGRHLERRHRVGVVGRHWYPGGAGCGEVAVEAGKLPGVLVVGHGRDGRSKGHWDVLVLLVTRRPGQVGHDTVEVFGHGPSSGRRLDVDLVMYSR